MDRLLTSLEEFIDTQDLPENGGTIHASIHAGISAVMFSAEEDTARRLIKAQSRMFGLLKKELELMGIEDGAMNEFKTNTFVENSMKVYDYLKLELAYGESDLAKALMSLSVERDGGEEDAS